MRFPYVEISGKALYMKEPAIPYYVTPHRALSTAAMSGVTVTKGAPQGKDGITYPGTYSITITGGSSGTYALADRALSDEFAAWWAANHGGSPVFDTTGCFNFTFSGGRVTTIVLQNDPPK